MNYTLADDVDASAKKIVSLLNAVSGDDNLLDLALDVCVDLAEFATTVVEDGNLGASRAVFYAVYQEVHDKLRSQWKEKYEEPKYKPILDEWNQYTGTETIYAEPNENSPLSLKFVTSFDEPGWDGYYYSHPSLNNGEVKHGYGAGSVYHDLVDHLPGKDIPSGLLSDIRRGILPDCS